MNELSLNPNIGEYDRNGVFYPVITKLDFGELDFWLGAMPYVKSMLLGGELQSIHRENRKANTLKRARAKVTIGCVLNNIKGTAASRRRVVSTDDDGVTVRRPNGKLGRLKWSSVYYMDVEGR